MLSAIRKNQYSLTLLIVVLTIISFVWLYNRTNLSQVGSNDVVSVYGRVIQQAEIDKLAREYQLAIALGLTDFVKNLGGFSENEDLAMANFIFNSLIIEHQATALDIVPSEEEIATAIQALPSFQIEGMFNASKYASFLKEKFIPRGFTERHLEEMISNSLRLKKLREVVMSPITVSEAQVRDIARIYQSVTAEVIRFDRNAFLKDPKAMMVTPEEEKSFYEKNKTAFVSDETRAVNYIVVELPAAQQKLQGKERVHALQQLSDTVSSLKQKSEEAIAQGKSFEKIVAENGFKAVATVNFNRRGEKAVEKNSVKNASKKQTATNVTADKLPPQEIVSVAFKLDKINDVSEVVQIGQAFYITSLLRVTPSHALDFAEVQPKIEVFLREQKADKAMNEAAKKAFQTIHQAMAAGKSFADALKLVGKNTETLSGITPASTGNISEQQQEIIKATLVLQEGEMSDLKRTESGDFIVYLQHRAPLSAADWNAHHEKIEQEFLEQQQNLLFSEWLIQSRADAKIIMLDKRHRGKKG